MHEDTRDDWRTAAPAHHLPVTANLPKIPSCVHQCKAIFTRHTFRHPIHNPTFGDTTQIKSTRSARIKGPLRFVPQTISQRKDRLKFIRHGRL
jgi:hypothetical protein